MVKLVVYLDFFRVKFGYGFSLSSYGRENKVINFDIGRFDYCGDI